MQFYLEKFIPPKNKKILMRKWIICSIEFNCKMLEMNYNLQTLASDWIHPCNGILCSSGKELGTFLWIDMEWFPVWKKRKIIFTVFTFQVRDKGKIYIYLFIYSKWNVRINQKLVRSVTYGWYWLEKEWNDWGLKQDRMDVTRVTFLKIYIFL